MRHGIGLVVLVLAVAFGATVRIDYALGADNFDVTSALGMLRSDPGLLYYLLECVIEAGGGIPSSFRADPRIEWPELTDVPATFAVGQEFVIAWLYSQFGEGTPLHVFCVWVMGVFASLAAVGVYGLGFELTRKVRWACLAAVLFALLPANYRTIGSILMREDFSLPWFALHLWWFARAVRLRTVGAMVATTVFGVFAAATWHASGLLLAIESAIVFAWFLRSGDNPLSARRAVAVPAIVALGAVVIPVLWSKAFVVSLTMQVLVALTAASVAGNRRPGARGLALAVACGVFAATWALSVVWKQWLGAGGDFAHVFELMWSKVVHLGDRPADPRQLSFDARIMWQGPFATMSGSEVWKLLGAGIVCAAPVLVSGISTWWRGRGDSRIAILSVFVVVSTVAAVLVSRLQILPGLLCPVATVAWLARMRDSVTAAPMAVVTIVVHAALLSGHLGDLRLVWYDPPEQRQELATLLQAIPELVPEGEPIAADFVNSTAILAHTRHPIISQPKWETARSRRRAEDFLLTFNRGSAEQMRRLLLDKYQCNYVVFDRRMLWGLGHYASGYPDGWRAPPPGTAAHLFCSEDPSVLNGVPGFRLIYQSPRSIRDPNGLRSDWVRMYRIDP